VCICNLAQREREIERERERERERFLGDGVLQGFVFRIQTIVRPLHAFATITIRLCHVVEDHIKSSIRPGSVNYVLNTSAAGFYWVFTTPRPLLQSLHCLQQRKADFAPDLLQSLIHVKAILLPFLVGPFVTLRNVTFVLGGINKIVPSSSLPII
jgi:hypothetical protein